MIKCVKKYDGEMLVDRPYCINLDRENNIIVSGFSQRNANDFSITTIKYSLFTNISNYENYNIAYSLLFQNYPNPFNPNTTIKYYLSTESYVEIKVYNSLGEEIKTLFGNRNFAGNHILKFYGGEFPSGIYFYTLFMNGNLINTKRMLLIK